MESPRVTGSTGCKELKSRQSTSEKDEKKPRDGLASLGAAVTS